MKEIHNPNVTIVYQCIGIKMIKIYYVAVLNPFDDDAHVRVALVGPNHSMIIPKGKWGVFTSCNITSRKCEGEPVIANIDFPVNTYVNVNIGCNGHNINQNIEQFPSAFPMNAYNYSVGEIYGICNVGCGDELRFYPNFPLCFDNKHCKI